MNIKSTTGRAPDIAAPQANPTNPLSQIGVSQTLNCPYFSNNPNVVLKFPPRLPIPSPKINILSFLFIS